MTEPLAIVIATALQEARRLDEQRMREIAREELAAAPATVKGTAPAREWVNKALAARTCGVGKKRLGKLLKAGLVKTRPNPTDPAHLEISLPSLREVLNGTTAPVNAEAWAQARQLARGGRK